MLYSLHLVAYLDPAAGSLLLQIILGGVAGLALVLKLFWHRILSLFGIRKPVDKAPKDDAPQNDAPDKEAAKDPTAG